MAMGQFNPIVTLNLSVTTLTFIGSTSIADTSTTALTLPAGTQLGDLMIVSERAISGTLGVIPPGFTQIVSSSTGNRIFSYRIVNGDTNVPAANGSTSGRRAAVMVFRPNLTIKEISIGSGNIIQDTTNADPEAITLPCATSTSAAIALGWYENANGSTVTPRTMTPTADGEVTVTASWLFHKFKLFNKGAAVDTVVDMTDVGSNNVLGAAWLKIV